MTARRAAASGGEAIQILRQRQRPCQGLGTRAWLDEQRADMEIAVAEAARLGARAIRSEATGVMTMTNEGHATGSPGISANEAIRAEAGLR